jgi:hypothetical protein
VLLLQVISYTEATHLEDRDGGASENGCIAEKTSSLHNSAGVQLLDETVHKHDVIGVDGSMHDSSSHAKTPPGNVNSSSALERSEHVFSTLESTESTPLVRKGSRIDDVDISTISSCDVSVSGHQTYERTSVCVQDCTESDLESPNRSYNIPVQNDVKSVNGTVTRNLSYSSDTEVNTLSDELVNINDSCQTSDMSQADFVVPHDIARGEHFNVELSEVPERVCKADVSLNDDVDRPQKMGGMGHSDDGDKVKEKKDLTTHKFKSYEEADKKCGLIMCNFPTVSNSLFIVYNNNNNNNNNNNSVIYYLCAKATATRPVTDIAQRM